jgi:hypothetical protein
MRDPGVRVSAALRSPALRAAAVFGVSGAAFALANLLLARALTPEDFGRFVLALALLNLGLHLGPMGAEGIVNRRAVDFGWPLLRRTLTTSAAVAAAALALAVGPYGLPWTEALLIASGVIAGAASRVAAAKRQSSLRLLGALSLHQSANLALLVAAGVAIGAGMQRSWFPVGAVTAAYVATAATAWRALLRERQSEVRPFDAFHWGEALSYFGIGTALMLLLQLERLVTPLALTLEDLATLGVLSSLLIAPLRPLQQGAGFTLLPRMRSASTPDRRRILLGELRIVGALVAVGGGAAWLIAPHALALAVGDKYPASPSLMIALLTGGVLRVAAGLAKSVATAVCANDELARLNRLVWIALLLGFALSGLVAPLGLEAIVWAANAAFLAHAALAGLLSMPHLRAPRVARIEAQAIGD